MGIFKKKKEEMSTERKVEIREQMNAAKRDKIKSRKQKKKEIKKLKRRMKKIFEISRKVEMLEVHLTFYNDELKCTAAFQRKDKLFADIRELIIKKT